MAFSRPIVSDAFLIHSRPFRENEFLCDILSPTLGLIRCRFSKSVPEIYRKFECRIQRKGDFYSSSDYRYVDPPIINNNDARLLGMYVNELCYLLLPNHNPETTFFGVYASTLVQLEYGKYIQAALRYLEIKILETIGSGIDYSKSSALEPIEPQLCYDFIVDKGFVIAAGGRYIGSLILSVAHRDFETQGALSLARECNYKRIVGALDGKPFLSKKWQLYPPNKDLEKFS